MVECHICGADNFEKQDGFMYCSVCQTQSQEFHEQELEYRQGNIVRRQKTSASHNKRKHQKTYEDDGVWTSWEAFNYILHGMTQEIKKLVTESNFESKVLKLWIAYLKECKVAFISKCKEQLPKLGFYFKQRDARVLYNVDIYSNASRTSGRKKSSNTSKRSNLSSSSISSVSKRSLAHKKNKLVASDYEEHFADSIMGRSNLADESLESLGRSTDYEISEDSVSTEKSFLMNYKRMLKKEDYKLYRRVKNCKKLLMNAKEQTTRNVQYVGKNKLLSILHLALLLIGSQIQLSDLLRFIREGHISFAKVTHFLPKEVRFSRKDGSFIDVISDSSMPTHLRQRQITNQLARFLNVKIIPSPNMTLLVERYCSELNLPSQITDLSRRILELCFPESTIPRSKSPLPSYEAWAMVSIIFIMKLLFGLNGKTEIFLSDLARKTNSLKENGDIKLFVFEDWQKFLECRKAVLIDFHFPTQEQLGRTGAESSKKFLGTLMKESKDEHRHNRFIPYSKYYIQENLTEGIKQMLNELTKSQDVDVMDFPPSITPQTTYIKTIISNLSSNNCNVGKHQLFPHEILNQDFKNCLIDFVFCPSDCCAFLKANNSRVPEKFNAIIESGLVPLHRNQLSCDSLFDCSSTYWILRHTSAANGQLGNFKDEVLEKTSENFQWFLKECSRMLEMNTRDVYDELLKLEQNVLDITEMIKKT